jgi:hypothetical protein
MVMHRLNVNEKSRRAQIPLKTETLIVGLEREKIYGNRVDKPRGVKEGIKRKEPRDMKVSRKERWRKIK